MGEHESTNFFETCFAKIGRGFSVLFVKDPREIKWIFVAHIVRDFRNGVLCECKQLAGSVQTLHFKKLLRCFADLSFEKVGETRSRCVAMFDQPV